MHRCVALLLLGACSLTSAQTVTITATDPDASEAGQDTGTFTVSVTPVQGSNLSVSLTRSGTASTSDMTGETSTVFIPSGAASADMVITPSLDNSIEGDETLIYTINANANYTVGSPDQATVTIADDPVTVSLTSTDLEAAEAGEDPASFIITRDNGGNINTGLSVTLVRTGTASSGDMDGEANSIFIPTGASSATLTITPNPDNAVEGDETVIYSIGANPTVYEIDGTDNTATATITDDPVTVSLTSTDLEAAEAGEDPASFVITRDNGGNINTGLSVTLVRTGTAGSGDMDGEANSIFIPTGASSATLTITPNPDNAIEGDETVIYTIGANPTVYQIDATDNTATATITDDPVTLSLTSTDLDAAEAGRDPASFIIARDNGGNINTSLSITLVRTGTAASSDMDGEANSIFIPTGASSATLTITPNPDNAVEGDETVIYTIGANPTVYQIDATDNTATATITDDPVTVSIALEDPDAAEANMNPGTFRISRDQGGDISRSLLVTLNRTGTASTSDMTGERSSISIPTGAAFSDMIITPTLDNITEGDETVIYTIGANPTTYLIDGAASTATLVILDFTDEIFSDGFEGNAPAPKSCVPAPAAVAMARYIDLGAAWTDRATGLTWSKCGANHRVDSVGDECHAIPAVSDQHAGGSIDLFNAGLLGDNAGFGDWRWPTSEELATLGEVSACRDGPLVR